VQVLADLELPGAASSATTSFLGSVSANLANMNFKTADEIRNGSYGDSNIDAKLVNKEQKAVRSQLDTFAGKDPSGYNTMIKEVNNLLNPKTSLDGAASGF
jgi:formiminotetrahydrofolate cyclodeaminase